LIIDDEYGVRTGIHQILDLEGYDSEEAKTGQEALAALDRSRFDVILIDYRLPDIDGLTLLQAIQSRDPEAMTCMITAYANIETAIAATRQGCDFFLPKPFSPDDLMGVIETVLRHKKLREDTARLKLAHEASLFELASEKNQTHSLVANLRDAVLVVNRDGEIVLVNRAMVKILGVEENRLLRQPAAGILAASPFASVQEAIAAPIAGRSVYDIEIEDRRYMVSLSPFYSDDGESLGHILTASDISEIRRLTLEKTRFIRTIIHEFRSPLGAVKGMLEVARDRSLGDDITPYLPLLERSEKRLDDLVELIGNLLSLTQIEMEGRKGPPLQAVDPRAMLEEIWDLYRAQAEARRIHYTVDSANDLPGVMIPPEDLRTILTNLIGNAIKYNRDGGRIQVRIMRSNAGEALISIRDTGLGIRTESLPKIFDEFYREKRPEMRSIEGNGLGLSIVKKLIERAAGRVEVTSAEGTGTSFYVYLPLGGSIEGPPPEDPADGLRPDLSKAPAEVRKAARMVLA